MPDFMDMFLKGHPGGAHHGAELPLLFDIESTSITLSPAHQTLSERMIGYCAAFAAHHCGFWATAT
ncbi:hypothetical protein [Nonomuraea fuscirosea]|uniref:hypothetical protein n=1 Tax=Nonomuraea fuscirosea TaxID=1291556 RepID=UPI00342021DA